jgi:hypothetical protein
VLRCFEKFDEGLLLRKAFLCSVNLMEKFLSVWPLLQSGQVSLYIPGDEYWFSWVLVWFVRWFRMEFLVRNAVFMLECLKRLVRYIVSFPV